MCLQPILLSDKHKLAPLAPVLTVVDNQRVTSGGDEHTVKQRNAACHQDSADHTFVVPHRRAWFRLMTQRVVFAWLF